MDGKLAIVLQPSLPSLCSIAFVERQVSKGAAVMQAQVTRSVLFSLLFIRFAAIHSQFQILLFPSHSATMAGLLSEEERTRGLAHCLPLRLLIELTMLLSICRTVL